VIRGVSPKVRSAIAWPNSWTRIETKTTPIHAKRRLPGRPWPRIAATRKNVTSIRTGNPAMRTSNAGITRRAGYPAEIIWSSDVSAA
jgi:hypothetical protein